MIKYYLLLVYLSMECEDLSQLVASLSEMCKHENNKYIYIIKHSYKINNIMPCSFFSNHGGFDTNLLHKVRLVPFRMPKMLYMSQ